MNSENWGNHIGISGSNNVLGLTQKNDGIIIQVFGVLNSSFDWEVIDKVEQILKKSTQFFVGRSEYIQKLNNFLHENSSGVLLIKGSAGLGKTALLANWVNSNSDKEYFIAYHFFSQHDNYTRSVKSAYFNLLRQLYDYYDLSNEQIPDDEEQLRIRLYNLLREHGAREDKSLVIVIDALDEAENPFSSPFPTPLPENVFVFASARAEKGEEPEYLSGWADCAEAIFLKPLSSETLTDWLRQTGEGELAAFADDAYFVAQLDEITQGFPLYLHFLIEELIHTVQQGQNAREVLAKTPKGFDHYVKQQLKSLDKLELPEHRWKFFALLAVAKGELEKEDIKVLTQMRDRQLRQLHQCWQVTRWMRITDDKLYAFAHPLLKTTFAKQLGDDAEDALQNLIEYCSRWPERQSLYALRHYAQHLYESNQWEELYKLARQESFRSSQQKYLPEEPNLSLKTVQTALLGAAETDNAVAMAEFLLLHVGRLGQIKAQESPLEALRTGSLERAWKLAEQFEIECCILWYLLLAWELKDEGKKDDAGETLDRLQQKNLPCFQGPGATNWQGEYAAYFFAYIFEVSEETCMALHQKLFESYNRRLLCNFLIERGEVNAALKVAEVIILELKQAFPLNDILKAQVEKGNSQETKAIFAKVLEITLKSFPSCCWVYWMGDLAKAQIEVGQEKEVKATFAEAIETAHKIENPMARTSTLIKISSSQADVGLFPDAYETLQSIDLQGVSEDSWISLAEVQAKLGDRKQAIISLNQAKNLAQNLDENHYCSILSRIVNTQAEFGELAKALKTTEELASLYPLLLEGLISSLLDKEKFDNKSFTAVLETANRIYERIKIPFYKALILTEIVVLQIKKAQRYKEDFSEALKATYRIQDQHYKIKALLAIVDAQTKLRWFDQAFKTAEMVDTQKDKDTALVSILQEQATAGQFEDAFTTASQVKDQHQQEDALVSIAKAYAQAKNFSHALKIANALLNSIKQVGLLKFVATIQLRDCLFKEARKTIAIGLRTSGEYEESSQRAFALINIGEILLQSSNNEKSLSIFINVYELSKKIKNVKEKVKVLASLGQMYAKADQRQEVKDMFTEAIEIVQKVEKQTSSKQVSIVKLFTQVGIAQARAGEFDIALDTVEKIQFFEGKAQVLKTLAQTHLKAEQKEKLKTTLATIYENIPNSMNWGFDHSATILSWIAVAKMALEEREEALANFSEACEIVTQEKAKKINTNPDSLLSTVALAQAEAGEIIFALENAKKIEDGLKQVRTLSGIALYQWDRGNKEDLLRTLDAAFKAKEKITDEQKQQVALWMIAQIQTMAGKVEEALRTAEQVLTDSNYLLCDITSILAKVKDKDNFKKLLIPSAYSFDTAYKMCGYLALLYPDQAASVVEIVSKFSY